MTRVYTELMSLLSEKDQQIVLLKQKLAAVSYEFREIQKAVERHRKEFATPQFVKEFNREVSLDFDDPLYPYCPFRLTKAELRKYVNGGERQK